MNDWLARHSQFGWLVLALILAVTILLGVLLVHMLSDQASAEQQARADAKSVTTIALHCLQSVGDASALPMAKDGPIGGVLAELAALPSVIGIGVFDAAGQKLLSYGDTAATSPAILVERPLSNPGGAILRVFIAQPSSRDLLVDYLVSGELLLLIIVPVCLFTVYRAYKVILIRPLDLIEAAMTDVEGNVWRTVSWSGRDRLGRLIGAFNRMVEALARNETRIREAADRAEAAVRAKDEFLANISHELRTPLNAILGFSEVLKDEMFGPLGGERYRAYANDIFASGSHLLQVINNILDLSKVAAGRFELEEEAFDLVATVSNCLRVVSQMAEQRGLSLIFKSQAALPFLLGDEVRVRQIVLNLLSNAIKFTPKDGVIAVTIELDERDSLIITVIDSGIGIAPADIERAFESFGQVENVLSRSHEGTGLGLPIARALAELHGATLILDSIPEQSADGGANPDHGTTITIRFPPERSVPRASIEPPAPRVVNG